MFGEYFRGKKFAFCEVSIDMYLNSMKKLLLTLILIVAGAIAVFAQDKLYYNAADRDTTASEASYYRIRIKKDAGWQVTDYYMNGKTKMTGTFSDDSCHVKQGDFAWYDSAGRDFHDCSYVANKENGVETYKYDNGQVNFTGAYKNGEKDGDWIGYYLNGKISGKATYNNGKQISAAFYHEDGTPNGEVREFLRESGYPGGARAWLAFLNQNLRYPSKAVKHKVQGTVVVQFIISTEGKAEDIQVIRSADKDLDAEAIRVIKLADSWIPAIYGGRLVKSYKKQPIVFRLEQM
jgi:TonB family protein